VLANVSLVTYFWRLVAMLVSHYGQIVSRTDAKTSFSLPSHSLWNILSYLWEQLNDLSCKPISFAIVACQKINSMFSTVALILSEFFTRPMSMYKKNSSKWNYYSMVKRKQSIASF